MKIAIPLADGKLTNHFGHCEFFAFIDVDESLKSITKKEEVVPPPHEPGLLPRWLKEKKVNLIIAGGMGQKARTLFTENGIKIIVGAEINSPEILVEAYLNNNLKTGENVCNHN